MIVKISLISSHHSTYRTTVSVVSVFYDRDIIPPWKPDVDGDMDTKYIPDEFQRELVAVTPPEKSVYSDLLDEPYFQRFSFHGSRQSLAQQSILSFGMDTSMGMSDPSSSSTYQN